MNNNNVTDPVSVVFSIVNPEKRSGAQSSMLSAFVKENLSVRRVELLVPLNDHDSADMLVSQLQKAQENIEIHQTEEELNAWDYKGTYIKLYKWLESFDFNLEKENYLFDMTGGTAIARAYLLNMAKDWIFPIKPIFQRTPGSSPPYEVVDIGAMHCMAMVATAGPRIASGQAVLASALPTLAAETQLAEKMRAVATRSNDPILLMGPSGVGKTQAAKGIYDIKFQTARIKGSLVSVNCATIQGDTAISMLFGHVKGAFTGATSDHHGYLMAANDGLLFLDEIGELPLAAQAMLLKAIEEKTFRPMGATIDVSSNFQLVVGTNRDLFKEVDKGGFRADLLARISVWSFELPAITEMRDRFEDFIDRALEKFLSTTMHGARFESAAKKDFLKFAVSSDASWPGNFRDLSASVHRMATLAENGIIGDEQVEDEIAELRKRWGISGKNSVETPHKNASAENMPNRYLEILDKLFPDKIKNMGFLDRVQLAYILEAFANNNNGADAYRALFDTKDNVSPNPSQNMIRLLEKLLPGSNFQVIKNMIVQLENDPDS